MALNRSETALDTRDGCKWGFSAMTPAARYFRILATWRFNPRVAYSADASTPDALVNDELSTNLYGRSVAFAARNRSYFSRAFWAFLVG